MMLNVINRPRILFIVSLLVCLPFVPAVQCAEPAHLFFEGFTGAAENGSAPVLLRWYSSEGKIPYTQFSIYRKEGAAASATPIEALSVTTRLRNELLIRSIFEQPVQRRAKDDLLDVLTYMLDEPVTDDSYVKQLIAVLDGEDQCPSCSMRRSMLIQSNYGVAIVEGLGYLDTVPTKTYTYELRTSTGSGKDNLVLGRITIDASSPTILPPPTQPEVVDVPGEKGNLKVFLKWGDSVDLKADITRMFGYNVYRLKGNQSGKLLEELIDRDLVQKINRLPILPPSKESKGTKPEEDYMFVDDNLHFGKTKPEGTPFIAGEQYTYWVTARDLFGQNGIASPGKESVIPDKSAPDVPTGLKALDPKTGAQRRIALTWNRNTDDTAVYKVYRYRKYQDAGKKTSFPLVDGLKEGYIATVPQPATGELHYIDADITVQNQENKGFWYCVSAMDSWNNESRLSPPAYGVLHDIQASKPPKQPEICLYGSECAITNFSLIEPVGKGLPNVVQVTFFITRTNPAIANAAIYRIYPKSDKDPQGKTVQIYDQPFCTGNALTVPDTIDPYQTERGITYRFSFRSRTGQGCEEVYLPQNYKERIMAVGTTPSFKIEVGTIQKKRCFPATPGVETQTPVDENGKPNFPEFTFEKTDDAAGLILYRSTDCLHYYPVQEVYFEEGAATLTIKDEFAPESGGKVCYSARTFDENHNVSASTYVETTVAYLANGEEMITPSLQRADPIGDSNNPALLLKWVGPTQGLAGYKIYFGTGETRTGGETTVQLKANEYKLNDQSVYETGIDQVSDQPITNLTVNQTYYISISAQLIDGSEIFSNNFLPFTWTSVTSPADHPAWPVRSLPAANTDLKARWITQGYTEYPFNSGIGVEVGTIDPKMMLSMSKVKIPLPFMVYRQRVDVPNKPYIQVSPLIFTIGKDANGQLKDPFFTVLSMQDEHLGYGLYFLDSVQLIKGAKYKYRLVTIDKGSGEIITEYGPTNVVEVMAP